MQLKMNKNNKNTRRAKSFLCSGVIAISVGSVFVLISIHLILNPEIPISCYGVLSAELSCKLDVLKAGAAGVFIGIGFLVARYYVLKKGE